MQPAADAMREALAEVGDRRAGRAGGRQRRRRAPITEPDAIRDALVGR